MAPSEQKPGAASPAVATRGSGSAISRGLRLLLFRLLNSRWQFALVLVALLPILGVIAWSFTARSGPLPHEQLAEALELLEKRGDPEARTRALWLAETLAQEKYVDPEFPGALEYILGIIAFRDAAELDASALDEQYEFAAKYLREAESRALDAAWRPEWAFALGTCLDHAGAVTEARPLLEEAYKDFAPGRTAAALRLSRIYLDLRTPESLARALELNTAALAGHALSAPARDDAWLVQAQILKALGRQDEAERAIAELSARSASKQGVILFRAETLIARNQHREALALLEPVAGDSSLQAEFASEACFLQGLCAESLGDVEDAIRYYERTSQRDARSPEGIAANVRAAELLRKSGRNEEALGAWRQVLAALNQPQDYRSRWLTVADARRIVLEAWNDWIQQEKFAEAIDLARVMAPLIPAAQAAELTARAHQLSAESLERQLEQANETLRSSRLPELRERWRQSGESYRELAETIRATTQYPDALWTSAEHFRRGHDYERALEQLDQFINTRPASLLPLALVRRGEILMDLDRQDEALAHFRRVIDEHPTDAAAFEARYVVGICHLERDELDQAEAAWRAIVTSTELSPAANEWRLSLFSLGRVLYHRAAANLAEFTRAEGIAEDAAAADRLDPIIRDCEEALRRLEEYLERYPASAEIRESRFLIAKLLQSRAAILDEQVKSAETDNARAELRREGEALLTRAADSLVLLREELRVAAANDRLDPLGHQLLRNCFFEIGHARNALGDYDQAIAAYTTAVNRYPQDPRVLLAYLQMSVAYERLGRMAESRAILEQARVALKQFPSGTFDVNSSNLSPAEWEQWLNWARRLHTPTSAPANPET